MYLYILIGIAVLLLGIVLLIATRPTEFAVVRSGTITAPPAKVFPHVNSFRNWNEWSPWAKLDPNATETYEGPEAGVGAKMEWNGNKKVGQGRMTILDSKSNEQIHIKLEFLRPMKCTNETQFSFKPEGQNTHVTWSMKGKNNFMGKAFCLFFNMDKMVGGDFEKGLANLQAVATK